MRKLLILTIILTGWVLQPVFSQQFTWEMDLDQFQKTGYYEVQIPALGTCKAKPDLSDLRLYQKDGTDEVPYLLDRSDAAKGSSTIRFGFETQENNVLKSSEVTIATDCPYEMNEITLKVDFEGKFYRKADLFEVSSTPEGTEQQILVQSFVLNSTETVLELPQRVYGPELLLKVANGDNRPLAFLEVSGSNPTHVLTAEFQSETPYVIRFGNPNTPAPVYDLQYFKDEIEILGTGGTHWEIRQIFAEEEVPEEVTEVVTPEETPWFKSQTLIWIVLILVVLLLGFMTVKMLKKT